MSVPPVTPPNRTLQYFLGLGIGLIPLIVFLVDFGITLGSSTGLNSLTNAIIPLLIVSVALYIIELIVTIIFLRREDLRFRGYGLLTAFLATPVIAFISCTVVPNLIHH